MKIRMMLATADKEYANRFAAGLKDTLEELSLSLCTNLDNLSEALEKEHFDICLGDQEALSRIEGDPVKLKLLLWDTFAENQPWDLSLHRVRKYQRISTIAAQVIRHYADVAEQNMLSSNQAAITVVWSPAGGSGKTMTAAAYALRASQKGRTATYLDLEHFSSTPALFPQPAVSISEAFEQMANNMALHLLSLRATDPTTGIGYFGAPDNYDDMNVFTQEQCMEIVKAAAEHSDELIIDLPSVCDDRTRGLFELASRIILVTDATRTAEVKLQQFMSQSSAFIKFRSKITLVANKGAAVPTAEELPVIQVPYIDAHSLTAVYTKISEFLG